MCVYVDWCRAAPRRCLWADLPRLGLLLEFGLGLPPGGQNHHLQLNCRLPLHTTVHRMHTHTPVITASVWHMHLESYQPATGILLFHTVVVHCKYQLNKSTVFISWYWTCMLMLKLAFSSIKHRQRIIYDSLVAFWCFWTVSILERWDQQNW